MPMLDRVHRDGGDDSSEATWDALRCCMAIVRRDHRSRAAAAIGGAAGEMIEAAEQPAALAIGGDRFISNVH
jgi:hypothetical protein